MDEINLTIIDLKERWEKVLIGTDKCVSCHPVAYRHIKSLARDIVQKPLDINDYLPTARKLVDLLKQMAPGGAETIFHFFIDRIHPKEVCQIGLLRVECRDLLDHLHEFDQWRINLHRLKIIK